MKNETTTIERLLSVYTYYIWLPWSTYNEYVYGYHLKKNPRHQDDYVIFDSYTRTITANS